MIRRGILLLGLVACTTARDASERTHGPPYATIEILGPG
jgi:hypothetical protein